MIIRYLEDGICNIESPLVSKEPLRIAVALNSYCNTEMNWYLSMLGTKNTKAFKLIHTA
jgi:hypothetical protein